MNLMDGQVDTITLVEKARQGDKESLNKLAEIARERLRVYVYRLTLQDDLAQEITQESLLEMCRVLGKLKRTDRFWSWLYGIATNKLRRHHRTERAQRNAAAHEERRRGPMKERQGGLENLVGQELKEIVSNAMRKLRTRHKAVLVMRCYDEMSYAEIAESMGCSEFSTRMLFMRAKRSLQKELSRNGFGKGSLLAALIIFGKATAPSEAAAAQLTVPVAATKVGVLAGVAGLATTKTAVISMAAAGALTVGAVATKAPSGGSAAAPGAVAGATSVVSPLATLEGDSPEYYYYFREGPDGPVMLRAEPKTNGGQLTQRVLQDAYANYNYQGNVVHINNYRAWSEDLSVFKLPTDSVELRAFLSRVEGTYDGPQPISAKGKDLLVVTGRGEGSDGQPWTVRHSNVLDEDYFQSDWRTDARTEDHRDAMHRRGWTYFRVGGHVNDRSVRGTGRIPFTYAGAAGNRPWLKLKIGNDLSIVDGGGSAYLRDAEGNVLSKYRGGNFFRGLGRPWMGLHTMDTVRRDAAEQEVWFETELSNNGTDVLVTTTHDEVKLVYTIDLETDVVERIDFLRDDAPIGYLEFEYLQDVDDAGREFSAPRARDYRMSYSRSRGMLWLVQLVNESLVR